MYWSPDSSSPGSPPQSWVQPPVPCVRGWGVFAFVDPIQKWFRHLTFLCLLSHIFFCCFQHRQFSDVVDSFLSFETDLFALVASSSVLRFRWSSSSCLITGNLDESTSELASQLCKFIASGHKNGDLVASSTLDSFGTTKKDSDLENQDPSSSRTRFPSRNAIFKLQTPRHRLWQC